MLTSTTGASVIGFLQSGFSAVNRNLSKKVLEIKKSVDDFGGIPDGVTNNDTAIYNAALASNGRFHFPGPGIYVCSSSIWSYPFTAGDNVQLKISGTLYDVSNSIAGAWRYTVDSPVLMSLRHALSGNIIQQWQDGAGGTATYFYRGLAFKTDSHWCQVKPASLNGSIDLLWQRSDLNSDPNGNRFNETFEESSDRLISSYATTVSGAPNFDTYLAVYAGTSPSLLFPGLRADFQQGYSVQARSGAVLKFAMVPGATKHVVKDLNSNNELGSVTRSEQTLAGLSFDTLLDTPSGVTQPKRWAGVFGDLSSNTLPVTKNIWSNAGATRNFVAGRMIVSAQPSGAAGSCRIARFTFDGTTVTITDETNTLPVNIVATLANVSGVLQLQCSYSGGLGGGCTLGVSLEWVGAGR